MALSRSAAITAALLVATSEAAKSNPLGQVLSLMDQLTAKVTADGEAEAKAYKEYFEWCDDASMNKNNDITTAKATQGKLEALIAELSANIEAGESTISDLAASISASEADLKSATEIREKESADFASSDKELADAIDTLGRAITILQREMAKNPAAFAQVTTSDGIQKLLQSMDVVIEAAGFSVSDKQKLTALLQSQNQESADEDADEAALGAPAAATYKTHSTSIFDVLEDMKEKAESQLASLRKAESTAKHNYAMLKQSLEDQLSADNTHLSEEKSAKAAAEQEKATAEGDLSVTLSDLKASQDALATANSNCMQVAADHEATVKARNEELKVIAEAKAILEKTSSGAVDQTYSLIQVNMMTGADLARSEVATMLKKLAKQYHSAALAQLASKVTAVARFGSGDPFAKIKGLIQDMITKLESEASSEATEKAYCDEELSKSNAKAAELTADIESLTTKIDQASARSSSLKSEVKELQKELATMAKEQADNEKWRADEHAAYVTAKADLELGLSGVRQALDLLRNYYGAAAFVQQPAKPEIFEKSGGAGDSIIGVLEVCESDFAENLAKEETEEADAQSTYDTYTQEYKVTKAKKEQDVKYKTQEFTSLDKSVSELSSDRETENSELSAVNEYLAQLKDRCIAKPETYEERSSRRNAEIAGLKEALSILEAEAFTQKRARGKRSHHAQGFLSSTA